MRSDQFSRTAIVVAAMRAIAYIEGDRHVLPDRYAVHLLPSVWRAAIRNRLVRWLYFRKINRSLVNGIVCTVLGRSQFTEDRIDALLKKKAVKQFVLLGAGLDSFAYRRSDLVGAVQVFEIDHPATQKYKLEATRRIGLAPPPNLHYLPCDFETDSIRDVLLRSDYSPKKKTVFGWLGIVQYLTSEAIEKVLAELATCAPAGSEIVFDFYDDGAFGPNPPADAKKIMAAAARRGEVMVSGHNPDSLKKILKKQGWELTEVLSPADLEKRYFHRPAVIAKNPFSFSWVARGVLKKPRKKKESLRGS